MRYFLTRLFYSFRRFMNGRYGFDELNKVLNIVAMLLWLVSLLFPYVYPFTVAILFWGLFRAYSRNIYKRQRELNNYLHIKNKIMGWFNLKKDIIKNRKTHRYYKCPICKANLRVPKGRGKIEISCPKCHHKFIEKT